MDRTLRKRFAQARPHFDQMMAGLRDCMPREDDETIAKYLAIALGIFDGKTPDSDAIKMLFMTLGAVKYIELLDCLAGNEDAREETNDA
jgi:hypothetical protein